MFLLTAACPTTFSQGWKWVTPIPTGDFISSACFIDTAQGWIVGGGSGIVMHTSDGGTTWDYQNVGKRIYLLSVYFVDKNYGWVAGGDYYGAIYRTTNGGKEWIPTPTRGDHYEFFSLKFFDKDTGFAASRSNEIVKTTDGGRSWDNIRINFNAIGAMTFLDTQKGFVLGDSLYKTTDGGTNWTTLSNQKGGISNFDIWFRDDKNGWIASPYKGLAATIDAGVTWQFQIPGLVAFTSISFPDPKFGWAFGSSGVYSSVDSGKSWEPLDTTRWLGKGRMLTRTWGVTPARSGELMQTSNGGHDWRNLCSKITYVILSSVFADASNRVWAAGGSNPSGGEVIFSSDAGSTWEKKLEHYPKWLRSITFKDSLTGWVTGDQGAMLKTTDGGTTWWPQSVTLANLGRMTFKDQSHGWCGGEGVILRTTNGGGIWDFFQVPGGDEINSLCFLNNTIGWAAGGTWNSQRGIILQTTDGGLSWSEQYNELVNPLKSVFFSDSLRGWAVGEVLLKTTDAGRSWVEDSLPEPSIYPRVFFTNRMNGWLTNYNGGIFHTTDEGVSWVRQETPTDGGILDITIRQDGVGYAAVDYGGILKTTTSGTNSIVDYPGSNIPSRLTLFQNYPNPFNGATRIQYRLAERSFVMLTVFNLLGQNVRNLVNEFQDAGNHNVILESRNLSTGMYFYRIQAGGHVDTKKLLLLR